MVSPIGQPDLWWATHHRAVSAPRTTHRRGARSRRRRYALDVAVWTHAALASKNSSIFPSEANYPLNNINTPLREDGTPLPAQPVLHDILTGSNLDGTVSASGTCSDWTSTTGTTRNGHSNRAGGGQNPSSWNSAHDTGCAEPTPPGTNFMGGSVSQGGGQGAIYCFAAD